MFSGDWKTYADTGVLSAYGTRTGVLGTILFDSVLDDAGRQIDRPVGVMDANDAQVFWFDYDDDGKLSAVRDAHDRQVSYDYTNGLLTGVQDVLSQQSTYEYNADGRLIRKVDAAGRERIITLNDAGDVVSVVDGRGKGYFFEYDYDKNKKEYYTQIKSSFGSIKEIWYDENGDTRRVDINGETIKKIMKDGRNELSSDSNGNVTTYKYDEWDNLLETVYPDGAIVRNHYDLTINKITEKIDERGVVTQFQYNADGLPTLKTEAAGSENERQTAYEYDTRGNLLRTIVLGDLNTIESVTTMTYDDNANMLSLTNAEQEETLFTHDHMGNILTRRDARGNQLTYTYDAAGRLVTSEDPLGNLSTIEYDAVGNKTKEIDAEGREKTYTYDERDHLIKITDNEGNETLFEYRLDGKLLMQTDPEGKTIRYVYDVQGRLVKTIDGNENEVKMTYNGSDGGCTSCAGGGTDQVSQITYPSFTKAFTYDVRGRKITETDHLDETLSYDTYFSHDESGNMVSKTDKEGISTQYLYDELNRLAAVIDPVSGRTEYSYDDRDNLIALKDAEGNLTRFEYDRSNRLKKEIRPMGQETRYNYDPAGNLSEKIDAKNQKTTYAYDDAGRLSQINYFTAAGDTAPVKTTDFSYDKLGNLKTYSDGVTSATYAYDEANRKTSETVNYGSFSLTNTYTYYKNGLKKSYTGPDGVTYEYAYDDNNQLIGVEIPGTGFITYNYLWNRPVGMTLPGNSIKEFTYDPLMRTTSIHTRDTAHNDVLNYAYAYDKMDNILTKTTAHGTYAYDYDDLYRLTTAGNPAGNDEAYTYDGVGNRLTAFGTGGNWDYNDNNELAGHPGVSYTYDSNGNMTQKADGNVTNYVYNIEDRLAEVRDDTGSLISTYYYDPFGRRLWKEVDGVRTYFLYADEGLVGEFNATGVQAKAYGYKPGSTWSTDPLFMKDGGEYYFYHNDHLGTPQKMTAVNGEVVWSAIYSSFGECQVLPNSTISNNLRFPGQYYDAETGLHYNAFRYFNYNTGRYLRNDPLGYAEGPNFFQYTDNNPINAIDPIGLQKICTPWMPTPETAWKDIKGERTGTLQSQIPSYFYLSLFDMTGISMYGTFIEYFYLQKQKKLRRWTRGCFIILFCHSDLKNYDEWRDTNDRKWDHRHLGTEFRRWDDPRNLPGFGPLDT